MPNAGLQLRRAIGIQAEENRLLEKHAIAPSAARLCWGARKISVKQESADSYDDEKQNNPNAETDGDPPRTFLSTRG